MKRLLLIFKPISYTFLLATLLLFCNSCDKDDDPIVETTVKDIDGNIYNTVTIGDQTWMVENLKTTKYNDGTNIPNVTNDNEWYALSTPGYCWYDNHIANKTNYGAIYNWYTINTAKLAPIGWHVPSDAEWLQLTDYLGGEDVAGGKLKEMGTTHWETPNDAATDEVGFTGLPGGYRVASFGSSTFYNIGNYGYFWTETETWAGTINFKSLLFNGCYVGSNYHNIYGKNSGFSVRCIKD